MSALIQHDDIEPILKRSGCARPVPPIVGQAMQQQQGRLVTAARPDIVQLQAIRLYHTFVPSIHRTYLPAK
jgi:hypothetical protein